MPRSTPACVAFTARSGAISVNDSTLFFGASDLNLPKLYDPSVAPSTTACAPAFGSTPAVSTMPVASEPRRPAARANAPAALRTSATVVSPFCAETECDTRRAVAARDHARLPRLAVEAERREPRAIDAERSTHRSLGEDADADGTRIARRAARDRELDGHVHSGFFGQVDLAGSASPSCQRAMVHSKSERRLRYGTTREGGGAAESAARSARRTTVRPRSRYAATLVLTGKHELLGLLEPRRQVVDERLEPIDHDLAHARLPRRELVAVLGSGRELGHEHVHVALEAHQHLVELAASFGFDARDAEDGLRLVDHAVRARLVGVLAHSSAVEEPGRAVIALLRVDLHPPRSLGDVLNSPRERDEAPVA